MTGQIVDVVGDRGRGQRGLSRVEGEPFDDLGGGGYRRAGRVPQPWFAQGDEHLEVPGGLVQVEGVRGRLSGQVVFPGAGGGDDERLLGREHGDTPATGAGRNGDPRQLERDGRGPSTGWDPDVFAAAFDVVDHVGARVAEIGQRPVVGDRRDFSGESRYARMRKDEVHVGPGSATAEGEHLAGGEVMELALAVDVRWPCGWLNDQVAHAVLPEEPTAR